MATQFLLLRVLGGEDEVVVVDSGEGVADVEDLLVDMDVVPVQAEGLALADAGADEDFDEVVHGRVDGVAVPQEADRFGTVQMTRSAAAGRGMRVGRAGLWVSLWWWTASPRALESVARHWWTVTLPRCWASWVWTKPAMCWWPRSSRRTPPRAGMRSWRV
jgi:hypothetical protein